MHTRLRPMASLLLVLVVLLAGCGGGGDGGSGGSGDEQGGQAGQGNKDAPDAKIALGTVKRVNYDKERLVLRPNQGEGLVTFGVRPQAKITLSGKKVELADVKEGQQAQVEYVVSNKLKRARSMQLFPAEQQTKGEQTTEKN